jgi:hypothetical protein
MPIHDLRRETMFLCSPIDVDFSCFTIVLGRGMRPNIRFAALCADRLRPHMGFAVGLPITPTGNGSQEGNETCQGYDGPERDIGICAPICMFLVS